MRTSRPAVRLLIPLVLLGLWVMHGMSATMESGCHGMVPVSLTASMSGMTDSSAMSPTTAIPAAAPALAADSGTTAVSPGRAAESDAGELCVSGQPPTPGDWALALLAALALVGCLVFASWSGQSWARRPAGSRWQWRGPPDQAGRALLTTVCVSRT